MTPLEKAARAAAEADGLDPDGFGARIPAERRMCLAHDCDCDQSEIFTAMIDHIKEG